VLFHLVAADNEDVVSAYKTIREELKAHSPALLHKTEYVFLTKRDLIPEKDFAKMLKALTKLNPECRALSMYDDGDCKKAEEVLNMLEKEKAAGKLRLEVVDTI
jgi:GTPase involved in cell partitioning and DNA repair